MQGLVLFILRQQFLGGNHCKDDDYCALNAIQVGTHESNPTEVQCTDCQSFQL